MTIKIPMGMELSPQDVDRGTIEEISTWSVNQEDGTLTLVDLAGFDPAGEAEATEGKTTEGAIPSEDETLEQFVNGVLSGQ
jgi:hypothetical protein